MSRTIFITATDTNAGKTWVTRSLLQAMLSQGLDAQALKPIASGMANNGLNDDVSQLQEVQPQKQNQDINYVTYGLPLAPALAAQKQDVSFSSEEFLLWQEKQLSQHDTTLIEGVGGLLVPLTVGESPWLVSDWIRETKDAEVMLIVPLRLGCINQALLSCEHLQKLGCPPQWLVLNDVDGEGSFEDTQAMLEPSLRQMFVSLPQFIQLAQDGSMPYQL